MIEQIIRKLVLPIALTTFSGCGTEDSSKKNNYFSDTLVSEDLHQDIVTLISEETSFETSLLSKICLRDHDSDGYGIKEDTQPSTGEICPIGYVNNPIIDCNDYTIKVSPASPELCDGMDNDCDGLVDEGFPSEKWYKDYDGDGFGDKDKPGEFCKNPGKYVKNNTDCDDEDKKINPGAIEECDLLDNDCNGLTDENLQRNCPPICGSGIESCHYGIWSGCSSPKPEVCDGIDNNCNGKVDEGFVLNKYYPDQDGDGFGSSDPEAAKYSCTLLEGYVNNNDDCDDSDKNVNPTMEEICNGIDDNCDGFVDLKYSDNTCIPYDFIFVIDNSGSMQWNDPENIRYAGLIKLFNATWQPEDRGTIIPFSDKYTVMGIFTSIVKDLVDYAIAAESCCPEFSGGTDIGKAITEAMSQFEPNFQKRAIILLTDGDTNPYPPVSTLNLTAKSENIEICALGLGDANVAYLSSLTTGVGDYVYIGSSLEDISNIPDFFNKSYISLKCQNWWECSPKGEWITKTGKCGKSGVN